MAPYSASEFLTLACYVIHGVTVAIFALGKIWRKIWTNVSDGCDCGDHLPNDPARNEESIRLVIVDVEFT